MPEEQKKEQEEKLKRILQEFCSKPENAKIVEFIKKGTYNTSTEEFTLTGDNGNKLIFKIDDLSNNTVDFSPLFQTNEIKKEELNTASNVVNFDDYKKNKMTEEENENFDNDIEEILDENFSTNTSIPTLYDLNNAIDEKNIEKVDSMLGTFSINENTGLVDIDKAIKTITAGTLNESVKCVQDNTNFSTDLSHYDLKGNSIRKQDELVEPVNTPDICDKSFNNILVYVKAAKLKGIIYDEEKQASAKKTYTTLFNDRLNVLGLTTHKAEEKDNVVEFNNESAKTRELALRPNTDLRKAGFADIFILTIIVIVYAVIIINLILKLK